jgi:hypothetical protein
MVTSIGLPAFGWQKRNDGWASLGCSRDEPALPTVRFTECMPTDMGDGRACQDEFLDER